jgi:hypothetical protein
MNTNKESSMECMPHLARAIAPCCIAILAACAIPAHAREDACDVPAGLHQSLRPARLILMGEVHGTMEAPAAFGTTVCHALEHGVAVSAGLELTPDQTAALARYLASSGDEIAVARLLQTPFWSRAAQDGRASVAMMALVERLRRLQQRYPLLSVFSLAEDSGLVDPGATRDVVMAARVRAERERRPEALILTLTGNLHNRLAPFPGARRGGQAMSRPMGALLADLAPRSVLLETDGGSAWACMPACGVPTTPRHDPPPHERLPFREPAPDPGYTSLWSLGSGTAAPPAKPAFQR